MLSFVDRILPIQSKQDQYQLINSPSKASSGPVRIGTLRKLVGERCKPEFSHPKVVLDHSSAQCFGVRRNSTLQHIDSCFRIEYRDTYRNLAKICCTKESEWRLLGIIKLVPARFGIGDDALKVFDVAVNKIDSLPADCQPGTAVNPRTPLVKAGYHRFGGIVEVCCQVTNPIGRKGLQFRVK